MQPALTTDVPSYQPTQIQPHRQRTTTIRPYKEVHRTEPIGGYGGTSPQTRMQRFSPHSEADQLRDHLRQMEAKLAIAEEEKKTCEMMVQSAEVRATWCAHHAIAKREEEFKSTAIEYKALTDHQREVAVSEARAQGAEDLRIQADTLAEYHNSVLQQVSEKWRAAASEDIQRFAYQADQAIQVVKSQTSSQIVMEANAQLAEQQRAFQDHKLAAVTKLEDVSQDLMLTRSYAENAEAQVLKLSGQLAEESQERLFAHEALRQAQASVAAYAQNYSGMVSQKLQIEDNAKVLIEQQQDRINRLDASLQELTNSIQQKDQALLSREQTLQNKEQALKQKENEIEHKDAVCEGLRNQLEVMTGESIEARQIIQQLTEEKSQSKPTVPQLPISWQSSREANAALPAQPANPSRETSQPEAGSDAALGPAFNTRGNSNAPAPTAPAQQGSSQGEAPIRPKKIKDYPDVSEYDNGRRGSLPNGENSKGQSSSPLFASPSGNTHHQRDPEFFRLDCSPCGEEDANKDPYAMLRAKTKDKKKKKGKSNDDDDDDEDEDKTENIVKCEKTFKFDALPPAPMFRGWYQGTITKILHRVQNHVKIVMVWLSKVQQANSLEELAEPEDSEFWCLSTRIAMALYDLLEGEFKRYVVNLRNKLQAHGHLLGGLQVLYLISNHYKYDKCAGGMFEKRHLQSLQLEGENIVGFKTNWDRLLDNMVETPPASDLEWLLSVQLEKHKPFTDLMTRYKQDIMLGEKSKDYFRLYRLMEAFITDKRTKTVLKQMDGGTSKVYAGIEDHRGRSSRKEKPKHVPHTCWQWRSRGNCSKGDSCPYVLDHTEENRGRKPSGGRTSRNRSGGNSNSPHGTRRTGSPFPNRRSRSTSRDSHEKRRIKQPSRGTSPSGKHDQPLCRDFANGHCPRGKKCDFWHPGPCRYFKQGRCNLGDKCVYRHERSASPAHSTSSKKSKSPSGNSPRNKGKKKGREKSRTQSSPRIPNDVAKDKLGEYKETLKKAQDAQRSLAALRGNTKKSSHKNSKDNSAHLAQAALSPRRNGESSHQEY